MNHGEYRERFERGLIRILPLMDVLARSISGGNGDGDRLVVKAAGTLYKDHYGQSFPKGRLRPALVKSLIDTMAGEDLLSERPAPPDTSEGVENIFGDEGIDAALARLTPLERLANILVANSDLSMEQIAYVFSVDPTDMREMLRQARIRLRSELVDVVRSVGGSPNAAPWTDETYPLSAAVQQDGDGDRGRLASGGGEL
jgi:hypothetical protein